MRALWQTTMLAVILLRASPAPAAVQAEVEVAEAAKSGTLTFACPGAGAFHIGVVYRDLIADLEEQYSILVDGRPFADFRANIKPGALWGDDRLYVWFSDKARDFQGGEKIQVKLAGNVLGPHQVFALYLVKPARLAAVRGLVSRESLVLPDRRLFTRIVGASDGPGARFYPLPAHPDHVEVLATSAALEGFAKKRVSYTIWGQYVSVIGPASKVNLLTTTAPRPEGYTKPIVTFEMTDKAGKQFGGQAFHIATRGTTRFVNTQLSPQFPGIPQTPDGANKLATEQALQQRKQGEPVRFGRPVAWEKNPLVWVVGRIGLDMYPQDADETLKARPDLKRDQVLTAYVIRVADGTDDPRQWPLFYWNSWFHGSEGEIHNEEITRLLADQYAEPGKRLWFYYDWRPGEKSYTDMMRPREVALLTKGGIPGRWIQYGLSMNKDANRVLLEPIGVWTQAGPLSIQDWIQKNKGADFLRKLLQEIGAP